MRGTLTMASLAAVLSLLSLGRPARAAESPPPADADQELPADHYPPPPPEGVYRPYWLSGGAGPGALLGSGDREVGISYDLRFGVGIARNLLVVVGFDSTGSGEGNPFTGDGFRRQQRTISAGLQHHPFLNAYYRGSAGLGFVSERNSRNSLDGSMGLAFTGALGYELVQWSAGAVGLELSANLTSYETASWSTLCLDVALGLF